MQTYIAHNIVYLSNCSLCMHRICFQLCRGKILYKRQLGTIVLLCCLLYHRFSVYLFYQLLREGVETLTIIVNLSIFLCSSFSFSFVWKRLWCAYIHRIVMSWWIHPFVTLKWPCYPWQYSVLTLTLFDINIAMPCFFCLRLARY